MFSIFMSTIASAHVSGFHDWPQNLESAEDIAYWAYEEGWYVSPIRTLPYSGTRLGMFVEKTDDSAISLEARWIDGDAKGPWMSLDMTFALPTLELWNQDFDSEQPPRALQFRTLEPQLMEYIEWDLLTPVQESLENPEPQYFSPTPPPASTYLSSALINLGVVPRTQWGAQTTNCSSPEDTWYRMAIHHVASQQTYNGSIQQRVQSLQAWAMNSGGYCDIPYQYLVGYDGTLWEARPINKYSGATGGGNNNGNIAVSFIGCYDQSACQNSFGFYNTETDVMMARARELIETLAQEHGIAVNHTNIKTHQDWPGNSTACPGNFIINRFDELLSPVPYYYGQVVGQSHNGPITIEEGETVDVWVDVTNTGQWAWDSNTKLAPFPRDVVSSVADSGWLNGTRVQAVNGSVSPNDTHRFSFRLYGNQPGTYTQQFTMVQEAFTWFGDTPFAGSPSDTAITFELVVETAAVPEPTSEPTSEPSTEPATEPASEPSNEDNEIISPIANAGGDQTVYLGEMVYLSATESYVPEDMSVMYIWNFTDASSMMLSYANTSTPYFHAKELGDWSIQLTILGDGLLIQDEVIISVISRDSDLEDTAIEEKPQACSTAPSNLALAWLGLLIVGYRRRTQS